MRTKKVLTPEEQAARAEKKRQNAKAWREANKERVREYQRAYSKSHPEKRKAAQIRYWNKKAQELRETEV